MFRESKEREKENLPKTARKTKRTSVSATEVLHLSPVVFSDQPCRGAETQTPLPTRSPSLLVPSKLEEEQRTNYLDTPKFTYYLLFIRKHSIRQKDMHSTRQSSTRNAFLALASRKASRTRFLPSMVPYQTSERQRTFCDSCNNNATGNTW